MTKINMGKIKTLKDYIHILCKYKGITMKQMCKDLNISYDSFKVDITKSIDVKYLFIIINYLDGDFLFAFDLLLNIDNTNSDDNVPTNTSPQIENFKDMVFDSLEDYRQQFEKFVNYYVDQNDIKTCIKSSGKLGELLTASCNIVVEPLDIYGEISTHYRFYMRRWDKPVYELLTKDDIQNYLFLIIKFLGLDSEKFSRWPKPKFIIEDLECFAFSNELTIYNPAPAYYVLTFNGIFNRKTKEFYPENSDKYNKLTKKYHFIDNASFNYLTESKHPEIVDLYKDFINRISNRNDSLKNEIEQHLCSVLNGYSEAGLILVKSESETNIDLLSELLSRLAGNYRYALMEVRKIRSNRSLNFLPYDLKLIYEYFEKGKVKLSSDVIYNCKRVFGRQPFLTSKNNGYYKYFKLRAPWFQFVYSEKDLKSLEHDTRDFNAKIIRICDKNISKRFINKFYDIMDANTSYGSTDRITTFADEIASYLLNNVDYPTN
jgi:hypothetical protein